MNDTGPYIALHELLSQCSHGKRITSLLKDPNGCSPSEWSFCIPMSFNDALDIELTERKIKGVGHLVWTQGANFRFKSGDTIYNTSLAYQEWSLAMKEIEYCIKVDEAMDVVPAKITAPRFSGLVKFRLLCPDAMRDKLVVREEVSMSQDKFVGFLIQAMVPVQEANAKMRASGITLEPLNLFE